MLVELFIGLKHCAVSQENLDSILRHRAVSQGDLKSPTKNFGPRVYDDYEWIIKCYIETHFRFLCNEYACII